MSTPQSLSQLPMLVPLDGSTRAESALPIARHLAECLGTSLLLARVVTPMPVPYVAPYTSMPPDAYYPAMSLPPETYQNVLQDEQQQVDTYLEAQAQSLTKSGVAARAVRAEGDPAPALLEICTKKHVGMVVMTTHGHTGLARIALGSVADQLVRESHLPVLLLRSHGASSETSEEETTDGRQLDHALVPLDGSTLAEAALPLVEELARARAIRRITLLRVVSFSADEPAQTGARSYLQTRAAELKARLASDECDVYPFLREGTAPSEKIIDQADAEQCLVVMATHGRSGVKRLLLGSVADQVVRSGHMPVLLIRPQSDSAPSS